jgi:hypothetical protein
MSPPLCSIAATEALASALAGHVLSVTFVTVGELTKWTLVRH